MELNKVKINNYKQNTYGKVVKTKNYTEYEDGSKLQIRHEGIPKTDNINTQKIEELIKKFVEQANVKDIKTIINFLRTIFEDYDERVLNIDYQNSEIKEYILFFNKNIIYYEIKGYDEISKSYKKFDINYSSYLGYNFRFADYNKETYDKVTEFLETFDELSYTNDQVESGLKLVKKINNNITNK